MTQEEFRKTDGCVCPYCGKRNTAELGAPEDNMGDVTWDWECHDCGREYRIKFEIAGYDPDGR